MLNPKKLSYRSNNNTTIFKKAFDFFVFTSLFIACCAVGMVFQSLYLFHLPHPFYFYGFVFFGTLCSYNFHWYLTPRHVKEHLLTLKIKWSQLHRRPHLLIAMVAAVAACVFLVLLYKHWVWLATAAVFTFLYTAPKLPFQPFIRLRRIAYGKTVFLALAWTHVTAMMPLLMADIEWQTAHYLFCINRFFLIYAICILFDLRDREEDRKDGIRSMITEYALNQVDVVYWGSIVVFFITGLWLALYFPAGVIAGLLIPGLILSYYYTWFKKQVSDYVYYFILDGLMVFSLPLLLLFRF